MRNNKNLKELVNQAKNRTRKLSHKEWDLISENWRTLSEGFLVRFMPYLNWRRIIESMKSEEDFNMIYRVLFTFQMPSEKCIWKDARKQGLRDHWMLDTDYWWNTDEKPTPVEVYWDAYEDNQSSYVAYNDNIPCRYVNKIFKHTYRLHNGIEISSFDKMMAKCIIGSGYLLNEEVFINIVEECYDRGFHKDYKFSVPWEMCKVDDIYDYNIDTMIGNVVNKIGNPEKWIAVFDNYISPENMAILQKKSLDKRRMENKIKRLVNHAERGIPMSKDEWNLLAREWINRNSLVTTKFVAFFLPYFDWMSLWKEIKKSPKAMEILNKLGDSVCEIPYDEVVEYASKYGIPTNNNHALLQHATEAGKSILYPYITEDIENIYGWSRSALLYWIEEFEERGGKFSPRSVENLLRDRYFVEYMYTESPEVKRVLEELEKIKNS